MEREVSKTKDNGIDIAFLLIILVLIVITIDLGTGFDLITPFGPLSPTMLLVIFCAIAFWVLAFSRKK